MEFTKFIAREIFRCKNGAGTFLSQHASKNSSHFWKGPAEKSTSSWREREREDLSRLFSLRIRNTNDSQLRDIFLHDMKRILKINWIQELQGLLDVFSRKEKIE